MFAHLRNHWGWILIISLLVVPFGSVHAQAACILRVNPAATGAGDGSTWTDGYTNLQTAIDAAAAAAAGGSGSCEVWVIAGTYTPVQPPSTDRTVSFAMRNGAAIYGGFEGDETSRDQRSWADNPTILSGEIGAPDSTADNSYHVIANSELWPIAILDGFTITGGRANGGDHILKYGAGMYNDLLSSPTLANLTFSDNAADHSGGGMYNSNFSDPTLTNVTFSGNTAASGGGIFNAYTSNPRLDHITFSGNSAGMYGGGMFNGDHCGPLLTNVTFSGNTAVYGGGGMYNTLYSGPTLENLTFSGNTATEGGGMYNDSYSSPGLNNVTFSGNTANNSGGGMYNDYFSSPFLSRVTFSSNTANTNGGGMYNTSDGNPGLNNVTFSGNTANNSGGGMYNSSDSSPTLNNVTFSGNTANNSGGGVYNYYSSPTLTNVTISGNTANTNGGGMYNDYYSSPQIRNSILWENLGGNISNAGSTPTFTNSLVGGCLPSGSWNPSCGLTGGNMLDADPLFVDAANDNLRLDYYSPARNAGNNNFLPGYVTSDLDGNARVVGANVDLGAYEVPFGIGEGNGPLACTIAEDSSLRTTLHVDTSGGGTAAWAISSPASRGVAAAGAGGSVTYTPNANANGSDSFTVRVVYNSQIDSVTINVTITPVNDAPVLAAIGDRTVDELAPLTFTAAGTDPLDNPANNLTYTLDNGAPNGASINATTGAFTWTPSEAQGPGTYPITVRVTDDGSPAASDTETFQVTVSSVNDLSLALSADLQTVQPGGTQVYTLTAANPNPDPASGLTFTATLPVGLTFWSGGSSAVCMAVGQDVTCTAGGIPAGGTLQVTLAATVAADLPSGAALSLTAHLAAAETDPNPGNNQASVSTRGEYRMFLPLMVKMP